MLKGPRDQFKGASTDKQLQFKDQKEHNFSINWNKMNLGKLSSPIDDLAWKVTQKKYDSRETAFCGAYCSVQLVLWC